MEPSRGEIAAVVGFGGQYELAARVVLAKLPTLEWIRVADPEAGVADDFQFKSGSRRHALQVKWSQPPGTFTWSDLTSGERGKQGLLTRLAAAWRRLRTVSKEPLTVYLCTNNHASRSQASATTPIADARAVGTRSLATFLTRSFEPVRLQVANGTTRWSDLACLQEIEQWASVWEALRRLAGLTDDEFVGFIRDLELRFGFQMSDPLVRPDHDSANSEVAHLAHTLQDVVRDPARPVELSREQLMDRLGWSDRLQYRHPHQFPVPAVYTTNEAARTELESRLGRLPGGYVALVGPAGSGKSTLLASLGLKGHVVRYYAFVPDAPDPLSGRGEADSFLHDLSLALEESGIYRRGIGNDLRTQRAVLLEQLDRAGQRWSDRGERTVIVVDGLDHVPREQNPTRSLLEELPASTALPDGVFVVLGTQTLTILPPLVQATLEQQDRTAQLPPLSAGEVEQIANAAGLKRWLYPGQTTALIEASEGHPLALTYLLQELGALETNEPDLGARRVLAARLLADASAYGGDIALRYRGYFQAVSDDRKVLDLLGMVARLRVPVNLDWLATWAESHAVSAFADRTATFFHREGSDWRFIHNSFRRFLADETARVADRIDKARDRQIHEQLATVCASSGEDWGIYRHEEIAHWFLSGHNDRVLDLATPEQLRRSLLDLRPPGTVRDHALLALRSATVIDNRRALLRMLLFLNELWLRGMVLETDPLATAVLQFDPRLAQEHIVRGGRLSTTLAAALEHAAAFAAGGNVDAARQILRTCNGLGGLAAGERPSPSAVANWSEVSWRLSGLDAVLAELDHHLPIPVAETTPSSDSAGIARENYDPGDEGSRRQIPRETQQVGERRERDVNNIDCRNLAHARCFDLLLETRDDDAVNVLMAVIDTEASPSWRARARLMRAKTASEDRARADVLRWVREIVDIDAERSALTELEEDDEESTDHGVGRAVPLSVRIAAAELLVRNGFRDAPEVDQLVPPGTAIRWPETVSSQEGLEPFRTLLGLYRLREVRPDPTLPDLMSASQRSPGEAGKERFRRALSTLARLEGQQLAAAAGVGDSPIIAAQADPIIRLLEVPPEQTRDWTGWYAVQHAALDLYHRVVDLAVEAGGSAELTRLLTLFEQAWKIPERARYWTPNRQHAVINAAMNAHPDGVPWASEWLEKLDSEINTRSYDPHDRVSLWLAQARAWAAAGNDAAACHAAQFAVGASLAIGTNDRDRQLDEWLDWLSTAVEAGEVTVSEFTTTVRNYASRIVSAKEEATNQAEAAAERLIALVFPGNVTLACELAEWVCESGALGEVDAIQALVLAACRHPNIPIEVGAAAASHLLYPLVLEPSKDIVEAVETRCPEDTGQALAMLRQATQVWQVRTLWLGETPSQQRTGESEELRRQNHGESSEVETIGALLTAMRNAVTAADCPQGGWDQAVERTATGTVSTAMARALLEQAIRLRLEGTALGGLAALASRSGETDLAVDGLADALSRGPGYGWLRHADGGTRLTLFDAALHDRPPALVALARNDLSSSLATGSLTGQLSPDNLRRIVELVAGPETVSGAWPDIESYLDEVAPAGTPMPDHGSSAALAISPLEAFAQWVVRYLGHPVRPLDFGARRTLGIVGHHDQSIGQRVLADAVSAGGWACEAALLILLATLSNEQRVTLSTALITVLRAAATGPDGVSRDLARRLLHGYGIQIPEPPHRPLPVGYGLTLPPLPERAAPELDRHGTPHLDLHDPQHLLAPFDDVLRALAERASLNPSTVLHRAAGIATASNERWIKGGHRAHASLLKTRQQFHSYRPWAFMAGRRALGLVLAELLDAGALENAPTYPAYFLGLVGEKIAGIVPLAVPSSMPSPWRPEGTQTHSVRSWCTETSLAMQEYASAYSAAFPYVLAEHGQWKSLEWGTPEEQRRVCATHPESAAGGLLLPAEPAWETTISGAYRYPSHLQLDWSHEELVLHGYELWTDTPYLQWLALHPAVGLRLGWRHDSEHLFTWRGAEGRWRARTVLMARGSLSHRPPADAACAEVWQVQLSAEGLAELVDVFPALKRSLEVTRTLSADSRERRAEESVSRIIDLPASQFS